MSNQNCLVGIVCPECKSEGPFFIVGTAEFEVYDDGAFVFTDLEWCATSPIRCASCGKRGVVRDFSFAIVAH